MDLTVGDWVRTERGEVGQVVLIARLSAFVEIHEAGGTKHIVSNLISSLTKIDPPADSGGGETARSS
jgi:hypothetical protein